MVAGQMASTPWAASKCKWPAGRLRLHRRSRGPLHPWKCRSTRPGRAYSPSASTTSPLPGAGDRLRSGHPGSPGHPSQRCDGGVYQSVFQDHCNAPLSHLPGTSDPLCNAIVPQFAGTGDGFCSFCAKRQRAEWRDSPARLQQNLKNAAADRAIAPPTAAFFIRSAGGATSLPLLGVKMIGPRKVGDPELTASSSARRTRTGPWCR